VKQAAAQLVAAGQRALAIGSLTLGTKLPRGGGADAVAGAYEDDRSWFALTAVFSLPLLSAGSQRSAARDCLEI
jgi:hypothetical protein